MGVFDKITNPLANLGQRVGQSLNLFRDVPESAGASNPAPAAVSMAPARAAGPWIRQYIDDSDFEAGEAWRSGAYIRLAQFRLPDSVEWRILKGETFNLYLKAVYRFAGTNLGAPGARVLSVPALQQTFQSKQSGGIALPTTYHPEIAAVRTSDGSKLTITAIDYVAKTITVTEPAGIPATADQIRLYVTTNDGDFRFRVARELGETDTVNTGIYNNSFAVAHAVDQFDGRTALYWPENTPLTQKQRLVLEVRSALEYVWTPQAENLINIAAFNREIRVFDDQALSRKAEGFQRRGY